MGKPNQPEGLNRKLLEEAGNQASFEITNINPNNTNPGNCKAVL